MEQSELAKALIEIAGSLEPRASVSEADLQAAHTVLARAIHSGQPVELIASPGLAVVPEATAAHISRLSKARISALESLASRVSADAGLRGQPQPAEQVYLRTTPILSVADPGIPAWARGMMPSKTLGPFTDAVGRLVWLDIFQPVKLVPIVRDPGAHPMGAFPIGPLNLATSRRTINLAQGSVWVMSRLLVPASPVNGFTGFRIKHGTLTFSTNVTVVNGVIHVPANTEVRLAATLDPPEAPMLSSGPGADATSAVANLPANVTISFTAPGARILELGNASATVYGTSVTLNHSNAAPRYDSIFRYCSECTGLPPEDV